MTKRNLSVPMGRSFIPWTAPEDVVFPVSRGVRPPRGTPEEALLEPEGSPSLGALSADVSRIAVVLPDATRLWQNVPLMAEALRAEIEKNTATPVTWMIGAGLHRSPSREETALLLGGASRPGDRVLWSDPAGVRDTGLRTSRGTPVAAPPEALDADLLVLAGGIGYHDLAGFSGGRKALLPGISGKESVQNNHGLCLAGGIEGLQVNVGRTSGNPTAEDMEEYGRLIGQGRKVFLLNVVPDEKGFPHCYAAGSLEAGWKKGVELAKVLQTLYIPRKAALIVASSGGYPYDIDLYQATKTISACLGALLPGGGLVLCAALEDGMGPGNFGRDLLLSLSDQEALFRQLQQNFTIPGFIALKIVHDMKTHPAALIAAKEDVPFPGRTFASFDEGMKWIRPRVPHGPVVYVPAGNCIVLKADEE
ncbi:MAG: lactate racemase domain-containing protein [Aminobacteriaceae bacterium]